MEDVPLLRFVAVAIVLVLAGSSPAYSGPKTEIDRLLSEAAEPGSGEQAIEAVRSAVMRISDPSDRVRALRRLAQVQAAQGRPEDGLVTLGQALSVVDAHQDSIGIEEVRRNEAEAEILMHLGRNREALALLEGALAERRRRGDQGEAARACNRIARANLNLGDFQKCATRALEALEVAEAVGEPSIAADAQFLLGFVNRDLQQYDRALELFRASTVSATSAGDKGRELRAINEEANVLHFLGRANEAIARKKVALDLAKTAGDLSGRGSIKNDIGFILANEGQNEEALEAFLEAFEIFRELGLLREASTTAANAAAILLNLDRPHKAKVWAERSLEMAREGDLPRVEEMALQILASIEEALGNSARALEFLHEAYTLGTETLRTETSRTIDDLEARFQAERRQAELEHEKTIHELELKREQIRRKLWFSAFLAMAIVMMLLANQYRLKARSHRAITLANDDLEAAHKRLDELARTDVLTGLANRREAETRLKAEARRFERSHQPFAVMMMDIDHFKRINDGHGHAVGDRVLEHLGEVLQASTRSIDLAARWGGEEFLLVLPETDLRGAGVVADGIRKRLHETPCTVGDRSFPITVTTGISLFRGEGVAACVMRADDALYAGKRDGRDRVVFEEG